LAVALGLPEATEEKAVLEKLTERLKAPEVQQTLPGEIITILGARIEALEKKVMSRESTQADERVRMVTLLSAEGKSPRREDGATYSRDELLALDVQTLKLLHANTPATVPLSASGMTSQIDGARQFVSKDAHGNVASVDLAGIFNSENRQNGQAAPKIS
jgi:hypothetical protein